MFEVAIFVLLIVVLAWGIITIWTNQDLDEDLF
jgi:hypothetical protein